MNDLQRDAVLGCAFFTIALSIFAILTAVAAVNILPL